MLNARKLKAIIVQNGKTQKDVANLLNISNQTFYRKMKKGNFGLSEMDEMIKVLHIENPTEIFFSQFATY